MEERRVEKSGWMDAVDSIQIRRNDEWRKEKKRRRSMHEEHTFRVDSVHETVRGSRLAGEKRRKIRHEDTSFFSHAFYASCSCSIVFIQPMLARTGKRRVLALRMEATDAPLPMVPPYHPLTCSSLSMARSNQKWMDDLGSDFGANWVQPQHKTRLDEGSLHLKWGLCVASPIKRVL